MTREKRDTELSDLKKEFETIKSSIEKITKNELSSSYDGIEAIISPIMEDLGAFIKKRKDGFYTTKDNCEEQIKSNPFLAAFGALGIGVIVGILIKKL